MSTPNTTATVPQPSSASKKAAAHMGTPHNTASPAPRSVPSPAATRKDHAGKTPVNHPTAGSSGSKTLASTPMVASLSQTGLGSSPGQHFGTPGALHGLGVDLGSGTPNLNVPTPMLAAAGMVPTMSEIMGVGAGRKRNEDEERKAKMNKILKKIGRSKGRVSKTGIERLARRCGLTCVGDDTEVSLAGVGEKMMLVVNLQGDTVEAVTPQIFVCESAKKEEEQHMSIAASKVLMQNLNVPNGVPLQSKLDQFAINLDRLAKMDRMSKGQVDCFEAINGVYQSLQKLYELEREAVKTLRDLAEGDENKVEREVLCKRSGRPLMHGNGKIGLSLNYWTPHQHPRSLQQASNMDGAAQHDVEADTDTWSLRIEAQPCAADMYPSLRVSDAWLPETFDLTQQEQGLPWQDPPNTFINTSSGETGDAMAIDGERLPDLRFVAKLDPPVVLPLQIAATILASLGDQYSHSNPFPIYHLSLLGIKSQDMSTKVFAEQKVLVPRGDAESEVSHEYTLDVSKGDLAYTLEEVPFSHPRQLVELLPTLRQWASTGNLLRNVFASHAGSDSKPAHALNGINISFGRDASLDELLDNVTIDGSAKMRVDVTFASGSTLPIPTPNVSLAFSGATGQELSTVVFHVMPNADIVVEHFDGVDVQAEAPALEQASEEQNAEQAQNDEAKKRKLARALEVCSDIGIWIEWMRMQSRSKV